MLRVETNPSTLPLNQSSLQAPVQSSPLHHHDYRAMSNIRPRLCTLHKWPHYDGKLTVASERTERVTMASFLSLGYGIHLARTEHWRGLRIGEIEPKSPAESAGLLREDVVIAINGHPIENDDFFDILSFIQHELQKDQIRFLVLDPNSADFARHYHMNINENHKNCIRLQTPVSTVDPKKLLLDQWRLANNYDRLITNEMNPDCPIDQPHIKQDDRVNEKPLTPPPQPSEFINGVRVRQKDLVRVLFSVLSNEQSLPSTRRSFVHRLLSTRRRFDWPWSTVR